MMNYGRWIALAILLAVGVIAMLVFFGVIAWPMEYVYIGAALVMVGLGAGQLMQKREVIPLFIVLAVAGGALVMVYLGTFPFFPTTPEHAYIGAGALGAGLFSGSTL